ncbi:MAG: hypothetical protein AB1629_05985 [Candidatus Omnitrophota bacterium]
MKHIAKALYFSLLVSCIFPIFFAFAQETNFIYTIKNNRDPFMPLVSPDGYIINLEPQSEISDINLEGIIFDPKGTSFAVINGNVIAENETVGKFKIVGVKKDKIILQNGKKTYIIELIKDKEELK